MGLFGPSAYYLVYRVIKSEESLNGSGFESYRCYGVTRRERKIVESAGFVILSAIALWIFGVCLLASVSFLAAVVRYGSLLAKVFVIGTGAVLILLLETRPLRKRLRFLRQLQRQCKRQVLTVKKNKPAYLAFVWMGEQPDLLVDTERERYAVHILAIKKYHSALYLEDKNTMKLRGLPRNNIFTAIFGFRPKTRYYPLFPVEEGEQTVDGRPVRRIVLLNPTCREMFEKMADGVTVPTGSGAKFCGYTVYTGSGFLNELRRIENAQEDE